MLHPVVVLTHLQYSMSFSSNERYFRLHFSVSFSYKQIHISFYYQIPTPNNCCNMSLWWNRNKNVYTQFPHDPMQTMAYRICAVHNRFVFSRLANRRFPLESSGGSSGWKCTNIFPHMNKMLNTYNVEWNFGACNWISLPILLHHSRIFCRRF